MKRTIINILTTAVLVTSAQAVTTFTFSAPITGTGTAFDGTSATGNVTYDETLVSSGSPTELFAPDATFSVDVFGQTFSHQDDAEFGSFAVLSFSPAGELALDFIVSESSLSTNPVAIDAAEVAEFAISIAPSASSASSYAATINTTVVPEPSSLMLLAGAGLLTFRRRR